MDEHDPEQGFAPEDIDPATGLPYWGARLKADLLKEIRQVSAQTKAKPSKNWVRVAVTGSIATSVVACYFMLRDHRGDVEKVTATTVASLAAHVAEEKAEREWTQTQVQEAANRVDGKIEKQDEKLDKVIWYLADQRRNRASRAGGE